MTESTETSSSLCNEEKTQLAMVEEVLQLFESHRYLAAELVYHKLMQTSQRCVFESVTKRIAEAQVILDNLLVRVAATHDVLKTGEVDDSWILGAHLFGVTTHYKLSDDGLLTVRLEGVLDNFPLFEQIAVIKEVDLFPSWIPFCNHAETVEKPRHAEVVAHISLHVPPITRDTLFHAYGSDCLFENGKILVMGTSIHDWPAPDNSAGASCVAASAGAKAQAQTTATAAASKPWLSTGWFLDRMVLHEFKAIAQVLGPSTAKTIIVAKVDPKLHLPQMLLNFVIKNLAGVILYLFQCQVEKVAQHPDCAHGERIRGDKGFYVDWLLPKIRAYCDFRQWEQPTITSLYEIGLPPSRKEDQEEGTEIYATAPLNTRDDGKISAVESHNGSEAHSGDADDSHVLLESFPASVTECEQSEAC